MKQLVAILLAVAGLSAAQGTQTFTGTITDDMCATADGHDRMRMGPNDAECTKACILLHNAGYVLFDGRNVYELSDQKTPEKFAGRKVRVTGVLNARTKTIQVTSIVADPPAPAGDRSGGR